MCLSPILHLLLPFYDLWTLNQVETLIEYILLQSGVQNSVHGTRLTKGFKYTTLN